MDSPMASFGGGSGDEDSPNSNQGRRSSYKRLTSAQTSILEKYIKDCPHPDEAQRRQLAYEIGLEPKQIKFWFQNKRTQIKNQHERADNNALRVENDRIQSENILMKEALKNMLCPVCAGSQCLQADHHGQHVIQKMQDENAQLKEEHEKVSSLLARYLEKQMSPPDDLHQAFIPITGSSSYAPTLGNSPNQVVGGSDQCPDTNLGYKTGDDGQLFPNSLGSSEGIEQALMSKVAIAAMEELVKLLQVNEPFWINSSTQDGKLNLHHEIYEKFFPRANHFKGDNVRVEATKDSGIVCINGMQLVEMFLDPEKWVNLFPTIVVKAETIKEVESGTVGNRNGALQLMFEQMHVLSPSVQPRDFQFLRYCHQIEEGAWVIADVSFESFRQKTSIFHSWRHPSGCLIQEMPNGCSMVTWVEHVEVDDKIQTHQLYKDLISTGNAYGAERWLMELQRIAERFSCFYLEKIPTNDSEGVIDSVEGRRSVMNFSHRMVKIFCESLSMSSNLDFPSLNMDNDSGIKVSIRQNTDPDGTIVAAATTIWLPLHYMKVFEYFIDDTKRAQWDVLCSGNTAHKAGHISNGIHPGNCISIFRPFVPSENNALIFQESFTNPMGSYIVYAPTDVAAMNMAIKGEDSSAIPILPSGFVISPDGAPNAAFGNFRHEKLGGSLLTVAFQIMAESKAEPNAQNMESVVAANNLVTSAITNIKEALNCNNLE